jgi:hypothetical protein
MVPRVRSAMIGTSHFRNNELFDGTIFKRVMRAFTASSAIAGGCQGCRGWKITGSSHIAACGLPERNDGCLLLA